MIHFSIRKPLAVCAALVLSAPLWAGSPKDASATAIYTYTGNNFDKFSGLTFDNTNQITGSFTVPDVLFSSPFLPTITPSDFSFSAGTATVDTSNALSLNIQIATNATGDITDWFIEAISVVHSLLTQSPPVTIPSDKACVITPAAPLTSDRSINSQGSGYYQHRPPSPNPPPCCYLVLAWLG